MRRNLFVFLLLSCLTLGAVDVQAQRHRRMHDPSAMVELRLSDDKFAILYNKVKNEAFIRQVCESTLPTYWVPKVYIGVDEFPMTGTGKPDRASARRMANNE